MKVKLTYIKDTPKVSATSGKNYTSRSIKVQEYGDKWLSGFANARNKNWKVGDVVDIEVKEVQKEDKTYLNFELPETEKSDPNYIKILFELTSMKLMLSAIVENTTPKSQKYPTRESEGMTEEPFPNEDTREVPAEAYES